MADTTENAAGAPRETGQKIADEMRQKGAEAAEAAKDAARTQAERARDEAYARGEEYRDYAAEETAKVADALRRASKDLSEGSPQERFFGQLADGVADAADRMSGMTLADTLRETDAFARRHPAAFIGGAALLGFAAARFLKASAQDDAQLYLPPTNRTTPGTSGTESASGAAGTTATPGTRTTPGASAVQPTSGSPARNEEPTI